MTSNDINDFPVETAADAAPDTTTEQEREEEIVAVPAETEPYRPVFNPAVRTIVYVVAAFAQIIAIGVASFGDPAVGAYIASAAGMLATAFGVAYNPMRLKQ